MYFKREVPNSNSPNAQRLSLEELKRQYTRFILDCGFFRENVKRKIESLQNNYDALISFYEVTIEQVREQIITNQNRIKDVEYYGEDGEQLKSRITNEIVRQNKYRDDLQFQLAKIKSLKVLFSLNPSELFEEALRNKASALLITQTGELIAKISNEQIMHMTHHDDEIIQALASVLAAREYTFNTPNIFAELKQQVQIESGKSFIIKKENAAIRDLLLKINNYLDKKIEKALQGNANPWALGYFGSRHQLDKGDKKVSVPQGIYELKGHLNQLDKNVPSDILTKMQNTLQIKNVESKDESLFQQFKRLISYLFGYAQSEETIKEYEYLEQVTIGKQSIS